MLSTETARIRYAGDGTTTNFAVPWYFLDGSDLKVVLRRTDGTEEVQNLTFAFLATGAGDPDGGSIEMGVAPASGETLAILRDETALQPTHYVANDDFPAASHELALDRLTMFAALSKDRWTRSLTLRDSDGLAAGQFLGMGNRIVDILDPVLDTDAATKGWVLGQIAAPANWSPDKDTAQWNADRLQSRSVGNVAPGNNDVLTWSESNNRWQPAQPSNLTAMLETENAWTAIQDFEGGVNVNGGNLTLIDHNFVFGGLGQSFQGTFYGTPISNRTVFKPDVTNQNCNVGFISRTAGFEAGVDCFGAADPDNSPILHIAASATSHIIDTGKTGTGTTQALTLSANGTSAIKIATNGRVLMAGASDNGAAVAVNGFVTKTTGAFRAHRNGVAYNVADSTFTQIDFTAEEYDQSGWFDLTSNRYTPLIPGKYILMGGNGPDAANSATTGKRHETLLYKNGVAHRLFNNQQMGGGASSTACGAALVDANGSTDYFEVYVWHNFGATTSFTGLASDCFFEGGHLG